MARITKKLSRLLAQAGTHTRGLLRIIAHMPAPLSLKLNVRSLSEAASKTEWSNYPLLAHLNQIEVLITQKSIPRSTNLD